MMPSSAPSSPGHPQDDRAHPLTRVGQGFGRDARAGPGGIPAPTELTFFGRPSWIGSYQTRETPRNSMAKSSRNKTQPTEVSVEDFLAGIGIESQREDARALSRLMI